MTCVLYILKSDIKTRHYIGIADDVQIRLLRHNSGGVRSTKAYRPWHIVHVEQFPDKATARTRESFLKKTALARQELFSKIDGPIV